MNSDDNDDDGDDDGQLALGRGNADGCFASNVEFCIDGSSVGVGGRVLESDGVSDTAVSVVCFDDIARPAWADLEYEPDPCTSASKIQETPTCAAHGSRVSVGTGSVANEFVSMLGFVKLLGGTSFCDTVDALNLDFSIVEDHIRGRDQVNVLEVLDFLRVAAPRTRFARRKISGLRQECFTFIRGLKRD